MLIDLAQWWLTLTFLVALAFCGRKVAPRKGDGGCAYRLAEHGYLSLREREVVLRAVRSGIDAGASFEEIKALALATLSLERERRATYVTGKEAQ